jgi:hypothetical protein
MSALDNLNANERAMIDRTMLDLLRVVPLGHAADRANAERQVESDRDALAKAFGPLLPDAFK